jgi:acyl dehydratase
MIVDSPTALLDLVGADLGTTDWVEVTQDRIARFADATGDHREDGAAGVDQGGGYLMLSMVNLFLPELLTVEGTSMGVNVGLDQVRFPAPVPSGSRVRARGEIVAASEEKGGVQATVRVTVEREAGDGDVDPEPACVADTVSRFFP